MTNQNLYPDLESTNSNVENIAATSDTSNNISVDSGSGIFSSIGSFFGDFFSNLDSMIVAVNYIFLAWSIFYTVILLIDFWYYRLRDTGEYANYKKGEESLASAQKMWFWYLLWLVLMTVYAFIPVSIATFFAILLLLFALFKFLVLDLAKAPLFSKVYEWSKEKISSESTSGISKIFGMISFAFLSIIVFFRDIILGVIHSLFSIFGPKE